MYRTLCQGGLLFLLCLAAPSFADTFSIPRSTGVTIDGSDDDWHDKGLQIAILNRMTHVGFTSEPSGEADVRLAWDDKGLMFYTKILDDQRQESDALYRGDSIEVLIAPQVGSADVLQVIIAPGIAGSKNPTPRLNVIGLGKLDSANPQIEVAGGPDATGYHLEVRIPWDSIGVTAQEGRNVGFQFIVNDRDLPYAKTANYTRLNNQIDHLCWYPNRHASSDPTQMMPLTLAVQPGSPVVASVAWTNDPAGQTLSVNTAERFVGKTVTIQQAGHPVGTAILTAKADRHLAQADVTLSTFDKHGAPLELSVDGESIASVPLYPVLDDRQQPIVTELLRTPDDARRYELLQQLDACTISSGLKSDIAVLLPLANLWANSRAMAEAGKMSDPDNYLEYGVDPMNPPTVRKDSPIYPLYCLFRGRNLVWRGMEGGDDSQILAEYAAGRELLKAAQAIVPDNPTINMYFIDSVPAAATLPRDAKAPEWANVERAGLEKLSDTIHWWIANRQRANGSYGGGWNDDCEMWRNWWPAMLAFEDPQIIDAQRKLTNATFAQNHMTAGYSSSFEDVEHSSEDSADTLTAMLYLEPQNPEWKDRAMTIAHIMRDVWTGKDDHGRLMFKNIVMNATKVGHDVKNAYDTTLDTRAVQPALVTWEQTHDPKLTELFTPWLDTWLQATASDTSGKPAGIVPTAIHFPDGRIGGPDGKWWDAQAYQAGLYDWPAYVGDELQTMLIAYRVTGQDKYLEPIRSMARIRGDYLKRNPTAGAQNAEPVALASFGPLKRHDASTELPPGTRDWAAAQMGNFLPGPLLVYRTLTGDKQFDDILRLDGDGYTQLAIDGDRNPVTRQLTGVAQAFSIDPAAYTTEVRWTDRVFRFLPGYLNIVSGTPMPLPNTRLLYEAATGDPTTWMGGRIPIVRWQTPPKDIAALVTKSGPTEFEAELYHFGSSDRSMGIELPRLEQGAYAVALVAKDPAGERELSRTAMDVTAEKALTQITLPSRSLCVIRIMRK